MNLRFMFKKREKIPFSGTVVVNAEHFLILFLFDALCFMLFVEVLVSVRFDVRFKLDCF